jgi:hypothetical protein
VFVNERADPADVAEQSLASRRNEMSADRFILVGFNPKQILGLCFAVNDRPKGKFIDKLELGDAIYPFTGYVVGI